MTDPRRVARTRCRQRRATATLVAFVASSAILALGPAATATTIEGAERISAGGEIGSGLFGGSVAVSGDGNTIVIGGPYDNDENGAAWVFVRSGSEWIEQAKLLPDDNAGRAEFGIDVALSQDGDTLLIGGPADGSSGDGSTPGAAWVFTRSGSTWTQQGSKLTAFGAAGYPEFGGSVALSADGDTALVGGPGNRDGLGAAWVFARSGETWADETQITSTGLGFGQQVALSSDARTALIGAGYGARAFVNSGDGWVPQGSWLPGGGDIALSSDGNTALVGNPIESKERGGAYVYVRTGEEWAQQGGELLPGGSSGQPQTGDSVALSPDGTTALVGGPYDRAGGAAWLYTRSGYAWTQQGEKLTASGPIGPCCKGGFGTRLALFSDDQTMLSGYPSAFAEQGDAWLGSFSSFRREAPELGKCTKSERIEKREGKTITTGQGDFSTSACTATDESGGVGAGDFEWQRGPNKVHFATALKVRAEIKLQTGHGQQVVCAGELGDGEFSGDRELVGVHMLLTGCHGNGIFESCTSAGAAEGEVDVAALTGTVGVITTSKEGPLKNVLGLDLQPVSGETVAEFECAGQPYRVTGSVICPLKTNTMLTTLNLAYASGKGIQKYTHFEGRPNDVLSMKVGAGSPEQVGLSGTIVISPEEKVELDTVY